jgi:hypothetical protein
MNKFNRIGKDIKIVIYANLTGKILINTITIKKNLFKKSL